MPMGRWWTIEGGWYGACRHQAGLGELYIKRLRLYDKKMVVVWNPTKEEEWKKKNEKVQQDTKTGKPKLGTGKLRGGRIGGKI